MNVSRETPAWKCWEASVPRETLDRLQLFADLLLRWNGRINLISRADEPILWQRHIIDSAQLAALIPSDAASGLDLGSGAGFPGLILSIVSGLWFDLVEADMRKASFLREAARLVAAPVAVRATRIERLRCGPSPLITARALAPLSTLLDFTRRFLKPETVCLFHKGASLGAELAEAEAKWEMSIERFPSVTDSAGTILRVRNLRPRIYGKAQ